MAYRPLLTLTPSASVPLTEGVRRDIAEVRPIAGRTDFRQQPLVIPTLKFQPLMEESVISRLRTGARQTTHGLLQTTGHRVGILQPNDHITGLTSSPSRVINTAVRKLPNPRATVAAIRQRLSL